jgi:hypothetical protein
MEILRVYAHSFVRISEHIGTSIQMIGEKDISTDDVFRSLLIDSVKELADICELEDLPVTSRLANRLLMVLTVQDSTSKELRDYASILQPEKKLNDAALRAQLMSLLDRFTDELETKAFLQIASARTSYFDHPQRGWEKIIVRFLDCLEDVEEMNRCFALSRYTAAMFHSLRIAEHGAIALGEYLGVVDPKKGGARHRRD